MTTTGADIEGTVRRAWALLIKNAIIVVPSLAGGVCVGIVVGFGLVFGALGVVVAASGKQNPGAEGAGIVVIAIVSLIALVLVTLIGIAQAAFTTGMAGTAWQTETTTLADGWQAFRSRGVQLFYAVLLLVLIGLGALILAPFTLLLSLLAYLIFTLYVAASVIVGGRDAADAVSESFHLAKQNFWPTTAIAGLLIAVSIIAAMLGAELGRAEPFLGSLTAAIVQQAVAAFATLLVVGEYIKLRAE